MTLVSSDIEFLRTAVAKRSGNVISAGQSYLFEARLLPVAKLAGFDSVEALVQDLKRNSVNPLYEKVTEAMTINETSFFRDMQPFDALKTQVVPELMKERARLRTLSVWSAASSSGQEAYSIAMCLMTHFPELAKWKVRIEGTDFSDEMVQRTNAGVYSQFEVNRGLPAAMLVRNFDRKGLNWEVKPALKAIVSAKRINLTENWTSIVKHDIVFLRNVLIYFDLPTKAKILNQVHKAMRPDGYMFLGGGETLIQLDVPFKRVSVGNTVAFQPVK